MNAVQPGTDVVLASQTRQITPSPWQVFVGPGVVDYTTGEPPPVATTVRRTTMVPVTEGQLVVDLPTGTWPASAEDVSNGGVLVGMAMQSGSEIDVMTVGDLTIATPWIPGTRLFLGLDGYPTPVIDPAALSIPIGHTIPNGIHVHRGFPIQTA